MANTQKPINVAILGATGAVGQRFIQLLEGHPWFRVAELVASERSAGKTYSEAARWVLSGNPPADLAAQEVLPLDADLQSPLVFSALPGDAAKEVEWRLAGAGHVVCSNASAYRMQPEVPILLPEINAEHAQLIKVQRQKHGWSGGIATNSNCTAAPVAMALAPLRPFGIEAVQVVSMQAVSGAGYPGVPSLDIIDNVVPYIGGEEPKLETEPRKMLGALAGDQIKFLDCVMSATCTRVPVLDSHLVSVSVRFSHDVSEDNLRDAWTAFVGPDPVPGLPSAPESPVVVRSEPDRPQPRRDRDTGNGMSTVVGRIRPCPVMGGWKFLALAHNTVRGAAGCSILNAELLVENGYL
ncbi:MAG: aspartate-semialdehyde dehydrogenase [Anaerolineae bacterium]|nr:aspartate-semialdehyde dehydrogenase [Anaerolineae bacterium]